MRTPRGKKPSRHATNKMLFKKKSRGSQRWSWLLLPVMHMLYQTTICCYIMHQAALRKQQKILQFIAVSNKKHCLLSCGEDDNIISCSDIKHPAEFTLKPMLPMWKRYGVTYWKRPTWRCHHYPHEVGLHHWSHPLEDILLPLRWWQQF